MWYAVNWLPRSSDSRTIRRPERFVVFYSLKIVSAQCLRRKHSKGWEQVASYLEGERLEASGQTGKRLVSRTGLRHDSQLGRRALRVSGGNLDTTNVGGLKGAGASSSAGEPATRDCASTARVAEGLLRSPREGRSRDHCDDAVADNWQIQFRDAQFVGASTRKCLVHIPTNFRSIERG